MHKNLSCQRHILLSVQNDQIDLFRTENIDQMFEQLLLGAAGASQRCQPDRDVQVA